METRNPIPFSASGCLSRIGLVTIVTTGVLVLVGLTMLVPPWIKVKSQRQQVLYWSQRVKDHETSFAGYHWLLAGNEWQTEKMGPLALPASGAVFEVTEYRIYWRLLIGEWVGIVFAAVCVFIISSRRLNVHSHPPDVEAEQSNALARANRPVSYGESTPHVL